MACILYWILTLLIATISISRVVHGDVTYDGRSLIINGERKILLSGSIHYPRSTPQMWPSLISKAKEGGLNVIQTYVFWNLHEPQRCKYDFSGRRDLVRFIKEIQAQGLYVSLRIGPFIEAEWTYGGLPLWLRDIPGIAFRSDNGPWKVFALSSSAKNLTTIKLLIKNPNTSYWMQAHMQNFTTMIVNMMKTEKLYASQGGPIIISQIENEYQNVEVAYHAKGPSYVRWAAAMAVGLDTGVPWMMCKQDDAPDPVYHGGTNFGRTGADYMTTSYYDQAPLDEYGLLREPKWSHLKELHAVVQLSSNPLLQGTQTYYSAGRQQQVYIASTILPFLFSLY
ncbi:hypothetical protein Cgig2_012015 [Carnegiea gigantea]|uniref:beta-galactosidase n=1 Tax=Carnegiea gigantea TaxID=171969 RepID=A0A9Q1KRR5_9CARY|nr:hypothetical protein Cgig2_012015 [Carnegiea gigantea]